MRAVRWFLPTILVVLPLVSAACAEEGPHWEANFEAAKRLAAQSNRLVLVHFWMNNCGPCRTLETNVFAQPGVGKAIDARFVPVKLNADDFPATARFYAIDRFPTDVIMTPAGRVLNKLGCPQDPAKYVAQLNDAAAAASGIAAGPAGPNLSSMAQSPAMPVNSTGNPYRATSGNPTPGAANAAIKPAAEAAGLSVYSQTNYAAYLHRDPATTKAATSPSAQSVPGATALHGVTPGPQIVTAQPAVPPNTLPLGLDGFCPVTLVERSRVAPQDPGCWLRGDPRWGAVHREVTYLFNGFNEQKRFLENPDRYAPALSGNDAVLAFDNGQLVRGRREFGIFCEGRIYLFANKETLDAFQKDPHRYAEAVGRAENPQHSAMR